MYAARTQAAYTNPIPAPLRIASREHKLPITTPAGLGITYSSPSEKPKVRRASEPVSKHPLLRDAAAVSAAAAAAAPIPVEWRNQPHDDPSSGVRVWQAESMRTPSGKVLPNSNKPLPQMPGEHMVVGQACAKMRHPNVHPASLHQQQQVPEWTFPESQPPSPAPTPAPAPVNPADPWGLYEIMRRLEASDDFFDIPPREGQPTLPRAGRDAQARAEASLAKAAAEPPSYLRTVDAGREAARRADQQAAGGRVTAEYHAAMRRIAGDDWTPPQYGDDEAQEGATAGGAPSDNEKGTPLVLDPSGAVRARRYTADKPNPPPLVTTQELQREKVKASLRASKRPASKK